jgi:hypothetical protein
VTVFPQSPALTAERHPLAHGCRSSDPSRSPRKPTGGIGLTVTRQRRTHKGSQADPRSVTEWMNAAQGLLYAVAALIAAVTGFIVHVLQN